MWTEIHMHRWVRTDGAVVMYDMRSPYPNPMNERSRMWTAWEPDPSQRSVSMTRGRLRKAQDGTYWTPRFPRRWKTAQAAMAEVNRLYPLKGGIESGNKSGKETGN